MNFDGYFYITTRYDWGRNVISQPVPNRFFASSSFKLIAALGCCTNIGGAYSR